MSDTPKKKFGKVTFIGGGVILDRDTMTYTPYKMVDGEVITGEPRPFPESEEEMAEIQAAADGGYNPPKLPEKRVVGFSIFQSVVTNEGRGFRLNGVPISDEEANKIWETSPDNPKNKTPNQQEGFRP